ncbi:GumC family protein [Catenovulum maritimum]|uniref:non-specific protein-tyrosine kinase n=1 Tax=Catenovulum maritimum TaxID=1513271 RepID=A0A0J8GT41_9ALTE|nr:polysaccharide biosynthesis tyrosine autokinase [Catenovulum maritimum]KMT64459.1 hypothetical protein XM47_14300 [Catenovulum maritimum]
MSVKGNMSSEEVIDLRAYWQVLLKYKYRIFGFVFFITLSVAVVVSGMKPVYRATASIMLKTEQDKAVSIDDVYTLDTSRKEYFLTQHEILRSNRIADAVIERAGLATQPEYQANANVSPISQVKSFMTGLLSQSANQVPSQEKAQRIENNRLLKAFKKNLGVSPVPKTLLVRISYDSYDPVLAAQVANTLGEVYIEQQFDAKLSITRKAVGWLGDRLEQLRNQLSSSERKLQSFRQEQGLIDIEGISSIVAKEIEDLSENYRDARQRRVQAESIDILLNGSINADSAELSSLTEVSNHPVIREIKREEIDAEKKVSELSKRYGPKHPKLISANAELTAVQRNLKGQINKLVKGIEKELVAAKESETKLLAQLNQAKQEYQQVSAKEAEYLALKREVQSNRNLYNTFLARFKETDITTGYDSQQARIIDMAKVPIMPVKPNKPLLVLITLIASTLFAVIVVFIFDALNDSFRTVAEIEERLKLKLMGLVPLIKKNKQGSIPVRSFYAQENRNFAESIRTMRTGLLLSNSDRECKVFTVTSSIPEEGKTTTSINLAFSMAQMERVLLVETDLRRPNVGKLFDLPPYQLGLSNLLTGAACFEECVVKDKESGVDIICAGAVPSNPLELLSSDKFKQFLTDAKQKYDRIVLDTAPANPVSDAAVIATLSDSVIYVVRANSTRHATVQQGLGKLIEVGARLDGVVLAQVDVNKKDGYGYQGYYDYYGYAEKSAI